MNNKHIQTNQTNPKDQKDQTFNLCSSKGICSPPPTISFLHEVLITYLQDLSFYLLKLKDLGITNENIKGSIINMLSSITIDLESDNDYFLNSLKNIYKSLTEARDLYQTICQDRNLQTNIPKLNIKNPEKITYSEVIKLGQKLSNKRSKIYNNEQKNLFDLTLNVIKSICVHIEELKELIVDEGSEEEDRVFWEIIKILNARNQKVLSLLELKEMTENIAKIDHELLHKLHKRRQRMYGDIVPTEINTTTKPGKIILVSGSNLKELELLLEATKGRGVDIYTHGHMLMAHTFPKFKAYKHLVGHWGRGIESHLLDFAEFPGAILVTKHSFLQLENLFRSRIFTTNVIAPKGVGLIKNNDFEPLIKSALDARGFNDSRMRDPIKTTLDEKAILEKISQLAAKFKKKEFNQIIIIGVSNHTRLQKEYYEKFLNLIDDNIFTISFSYTTKNKNILFIESDYGFPILYRSLEILLKNIAIENLNPTILLNRCEVHTISNVIYLKTIGFKNMYFTDCQPTLINPAVIKTLRNLYGLNNYTSPEADYKKILTEGKANLK